MSAKSIMGRSRSRQDPRSLLNEGLLWKEYQGSLCREVPRLRGAPGESVEYHPPGGGAESLVATALRIEKVYKHQQAILDRLARPGTDSEDRSTTVALPFGSGRTTAIALWLLPRLFERGRSVLVLCPTDDLAGRQKELWKGALDRAHLSWLVGLTQLRTRDLEERLGSSLLPGTAIFTDLPTLHRLLREYGKDVAELAVFQEAVIAEDLESLEGPMASHARYVIGRYRYFLASKGFSPPWITVLPGMTNPAEFAGQLGIPGRVEDLVDRAGTSTRSLSVWAPSAMNVDIESVSGDSGPSMTLRVVRRRYWQELVNLASTSIATGRTTGIISGEIRATDAEINQILDDVRLRIEKGESPPVPDLDEILFLGSDLPSLRSALLKKGKDIGDLRTLLLAGYQNAGAFLETETRHLAAAGHLDILLLAPRTPLYQYYMNRPDELIDVADDMHREVRPLPRTLYNLPVRSEEALRYHAETFLGELEGPVDEDLARNLLSSDFLAAVEKAERERAASEDSDGAPDSRVQEALATLEVITDRVMAIRDIGGAADRILAWVDAVNAPALYFEGAVFVMHGRRHRVNRWSNAGDDILVQAEPRAQMSKRISRIAIEEVEEIGRAVKTDGYSFGRWKVKVTEEVIGRRTYQGLDLDTEGESEMWAGPSPPRREFEAPALRISLARGDSGHGASVVHGVAHLLRSALSVEQGSLHSRLQFVATESSIYIYDDLLRSAQAIADLDTEGAILSAFRRAWRILADCPCDEDSGCCGCLHDWSCSDPGHGNGPGDPLLNKWATLGFLSDVLGDDQEAHVQAALLGEKRSVSSNGKLRQMKEKCLRVMADKQRSLVRRPYRFRLATEDDVRNTGGGWAGLCRHGKKMILIVPGFSEAKTQDIVIHEYFHNFQGEGNLGPRLRHYRDWDMDGPWGVHSFRPLRFLRGLSPLFHPQNIPFQGKLFVEGSANWSVVVSSDFWGSKTRFIENKLSGSNEYLEGYNAVNWVQVPYGVVRTLEFLRNGTIAGSVLTIRDVIENSPAAANIRDQGKTANNSPNNELKCLPTGFRDKLDDVVIVSHYLARIPPDDSLAGARGFQLLWIVITGRFGDMSVDAFLKTFEPFGAYGIMNAVFKRHYEDFDEIPCLKMNCRSITKERLADACVIHSGRRLLLGLLGIRTRLLAAMLLRLPLVFLRGGEGEGGG
ncbi:MAG: hypothetical protein ABIK65_12995 [Candidatus Eisenbacteria bacterium]